jgi:hypothetical protein
MFWVRGYRYIRLYRYTYWVSRYIRLDIYWVRRYIRIYSVCTHTRSGRQISLYTITHTGQGVH